MKLSLKKKAGTLIIRVLWGSFILGVISIIIVFTLITRGVIGYMPDIKELENPIDKFASQIYTADNEIIGTYSYSKDNRVYGSYDELSPYLVEALVATEDARYYSHSGIDFQALLRVFVKTILLGKDSGGGGSTISQQLAKQLYSPSVENKIQRLLQKPIEWVIAVQLEKYYTKEEIINLYFNKFDFLYNAVGIQSATQVYFNKRPDELSIAEAATLVGMCKNPSYYNPVRRNERTRNRRNVVLEQMQKAGYLSQAQTDSIKNTPLSLQFNALDHKEGLAPYFREYLRLTMNAPKPERKNYFSWQMQQYVRDSIEWETNPLYGWCKKNKKADGSNYNIYTDGLKIYTSLDATMQKYAEEAVDKHIGGYLQPLFEREKRGRKHAPYSEKYALQVPQFLDRAIRNSDRYRIMKKGGASAGEIQKAFNTPVEMKVFSWHGDIDTTMTPLDSIKYNKKFLRTGFMAMDPRNGQVKAYVGGINFKYFQYDMVTQGRRQVGSTIKPFLYALAMEDGMTPCEEMLHGPQTLIQENGRPWTPRNGNRNRIGQLVSLRWGLQNSDNWVTAYLMKQLSPYAFVRLLHSFGITGQIDPVVSLALGPCEVSLSEMVGAYSAFVNKGIRTKPLFVTRIEDEFGNVITNLTPQTHEVLSEDTYVKMIDMLQAVINGGTGSRLRNIYKLTAPLGGKTGTTQENSDGWFMCISPELAMGCWVGGEERSIHFDRITQGQGAAMALPVIGLFLQNIYKDNSLGYSQSSQFETIPGKSACGSNNEENESLLSVDNNESIDDLFE